ncbi:Uncharacterised protein [Mycobacterium tuberculosis]|nr:Uncharacterised protein [Mycobacterium tuberculosis]
MPGRFNRVIVRSFDSGYESGWNTGWVACPPIR